MLNERELYIFEHRIMTDEPMTFQEIGDHFGISRERARQIEKVLSDKVSKYLIGSEAGRPGGESAGRAPLQAARPDEPLLARHLPERLAHDLPRRLR